MANRHPDYMKYPGDDVHYSVAGQVAWSQFVVARARRTLPGTLTPRERCRASARLAARDVLHALLAGRDPRHHAAQLGADLLDRVLRRRFAHLVEVGAAVLVLGDPLPANAPDWISPRSSSSRPWSSA